MHFPDEFIGKVFQNTSWETLIDWKNLTG